MNFLAEFAIAFYLAVNSLLGIPSENMEFVQVKMDANSEKKVIYTDNGFAFEIPSTWSVTENKAGNLQKFVVTNAGGAESFTLSCGAVPPTGGPYGALTTTELHRTVETSSEVYVINYEEWRLEEGLDQPAEGTHYVTMLVVPESNAYHLLVPGVLQQCTLRSRSEWPPHALSSEFLSVTRGIYESWSVAE